jgi:hypothetical protein
MRSTMLPCTDIEAYRAWRERRVGPAYFRGQPSYVWRTALTHGCRQLAA